MSGIIFRKGKGPWISPTDSGYASEDQLQAMISEFPELLPGVSAHPGSLLTWFRGPRIPARRTNACSLS